MDCLKIKNYSIWSRCPTQLFVLLELYSPATGILFTVDGEIELALHEMWQVSGLLIGDVPYEEYFSDSEELKILSLRDSHYTILYEI